MHIFNQMSFIQVSFVSWSLKVSEISRLQNMFFNGSLTIDFHCQSLLYIFDFPIHKTSHIIWMYLCKHGYMRYIIILYITKSNIWYLSNYPKTIQFEVFDVKKKTISILYLSFCYPTHHMNKVLVDYWFCQNILNNN